MSEQEKTELISHEAIERFRRDLLVLLRRHVRLSVGLRLRLGARSNCGDHRLVGLLRLGLALFLPLAVPSALRHYFYEGPPSTEQLDRCGLLI
jgi:hypothetical protein